MGSQGRDLMRNLESGTKTEAMGMLNVHYPWLARACSLNHGLPTQDATAHSGLCVLASIISQGNVPTNMSTGQSGEKRFLTLLLLLKWLQLVTSWQKSNQALVILSSLYILILTLHQIYRWYFFHSAGCLFIHIIVSVPIYKHYILYFVNIIHYKHSLASWRLIFSYWYACGLEVHLM